MFQFFFIFVNLDKAKKKGVRSNLHVSFKCPVFATHVILFWISPILFLQEVVGFAELLFIDSMSGKGDSVMEERNNLAITLAYSY